MHLPFASNSIVFPDSGTCTGTFDALTNASVLLPDRTLPFTVPTSLFASITLTHEPSGTEVQDQIGRFV